MALYEKGASRIEVFVHRDGGGGEVGAKETEAKDASAPKSPEDEKAAKSAFTKKFIRTNVTHAIATARQVGRLFLTYHLTGIGARHGDQALQDSVMRNVEVLQDFGGLATSVAMGATYGASGGPLGSIIGATLAGIGTAASTGVKYMTRQREFDYKMFKEENAIQYARARASINLTTGRLR